jgi:hypothetical protein
MSPSAIKGLIILPFLEETPIIPIPGQRSFYHLLYKAFTNLFGSSFPHIFNISLNFPVLL